ncbi:MAG TPA: hypothetical protein VEZ90_03975 [Blastocatellia bacterium]|nr:hypothetical protein [Blastocatellia bacterium]
MVCWEQGGSEPVYLCAIHAEELKLRSEKRAEGRKASGAGADSGCGKARPKEEAHSTSAADAKIIQGRPVEASPSAEEPAKPFSKIELDGTFEKAAKPSSKFRPDTISEPTSGPDEPVASRSQPVETGEAVVKPAETAPEPFQPAGSAPASEQSEPSTKKSHGQTKTEESVLSRQANSSPKGPVLPPGVVKAVRLARDTSARPAVRDLTFGNPAKAIVDEAIWNLPTGDHEAFRAALQKGKPAAEAAQTAGGQLAAIHRRVTEYSLKIDAVLATSAKTIAVREAIDKPLEQAMIEIIENDSMTDSDKDAAIQQLGALQEWAKYGLQAQFTALEANRGLLAIGERMSWGRPNEIPDRLKPAYRALFGSLKQAIHAAAPDAQEILERLVNLHAAKSDLLALPAPELLPR